jgi:hypothetical protein
MSRWRRGKHSVPYSFDAIADVTFVLGAEPNGRYRFVFANKAFEKTTGLPVG